MSKVQPPVLGFNNNVRHRGRIVHIQTEDSGVKIPRIVTHLFADGGRIIKTSRTDYKELLDAEDLQNRVRLLMKAQHKAMFTALRQGEFDELLEAACGPHPLPPSSSKVAAPDSSSLLSAEPARADAPQSSSLPAPVSASHPRLSSAAPVSATLSRPASLYDSAPAKSARSIFGDGVLNEKSLDEVILSYLAEDADGSTK